MSPGALLFMALAWIFVLGLTFWSFARILRAQAHFAPDGIGPAAPPVAGRAEGPGHG
ncbi:MAG TPA: hypothetical protein VF665_03145 [Longimicrobium sp.]|uniref:hypothetical protein n=1 Tax=Longimicrobium sp. TaxID=2029185 RepID=UPI002ED97443